MNIGFRIIVCFWYLLSLLPLKALYILSDFIFLPLYYLVRYRRKIVRKNLVDSFPKKSKKDIIKIEKQFYHNFCDYIVETIKLFSVSKSEMKKRITFSGIDEIVEEMDAKDKNFCFVYLGHICNWEWVASLPYWAPKSLLCAQIYHPLYNKDFDKLFLKLRNQFGGESISMKDTLRRIITLKRAKQKTIIGFISDQAPKWNSIHHWVEFLNHDTPVFTGTEKISKQVDALVYYADVRRIKRGYYSCEFKPLIDQDVKSVPDFELTDKYCELLEKMIIENPANWLWSHNRWKRTKEEWLKREASNSES